MIAHQPNRALPAMLRLEERLREQVQLSAAGENNPQEFRLQVRERAENRQGPKASPTDKQPNSSTEPATPIPPSDNGNKNGGNKPTNQPGHGNQNNGQGQDKPGNDSHGSKPTPKP